ncbi:MAG: glycosyltransferase family 4 protein [Patescibacteria group bacterium]
MEQIKPKKILIFSLVYYPRFIGGAEVAIKEITDRIPKEEIEFDIIALRKNSIFFILWKFLFPFYAFIKALYLHRKNKYDAIWSMMASYAGFAGFLFKKIYPEIPFILSIQEGENFRKREGMFNFLFRKIFSNADHIQVISKFLSDWSLYMGAKCPITIVPNGVDLDLFSKRDLEKENKLKANFNKKENDIFLITTSRLVVKNAVEDIIDALSYLPENVKSLILGQGYQEEELKEKVENLKLKDRVHFLGFVPHKDMPQYLHISDIFIRPSLSEGFGNSYIEAMAAGIPVIATPVGGIVDFLRDGETGLFCEVQNPRSIVQKIEKLIKDKESRDYIVQNAIKMVKEKYDWNIIANDMKNNVFLKTI